MPPFSQGNLSLLTSRLFRSPLAAWIGRPVVRRLATMSDGDQKLDRMENGPKRVKLTGRKFYESIGSPKYVLAPMVDQSEFAWRMLSRSYLPSDANPPLLAYSPMLHARLFASEPKYRRVHFQPTRAANNNKEAHDASNKPRTAATAATAGSEGNGDQTPWLDGNPSLDRPLFVQFCANDPTQFLAAARHVAPFCDAVDLNLGCPQGIARKGHYGAFLQEDQTLVRQLVRTLASGDNGGGGGLDVPVTAKMRVLDTPEATLAYARGILDAGASILTVHGRRREQKGHLTGLADWAAIRHLRDNLPADTVLFANGNVLGREDLDRCLEATGADAVMSAEGNLSDPAIFAPVPPPGREGREYWRGRDGDGGSRGGWRVDGMVRRYLDILHRHVLEREPPSRRPLFVPGDSTAWIDELEDRWRAEAEEPAGQPPRKKRRKSDKEGGAGGGDGDDVLSAAAFSTNMSAVQPHMFHLLRHFVTRHTDVRDALARARKGGGGGGLLDGYERVLDMVEIRVARGLMEYERTDGASIEAEWAAAEEATREKERKKKQEQQQLAEAKKGKLTKTAGTAEEEQEMQEEVEEGTKQEGARVVEETLDQELDGQSSAAAVKRCRRPWWIAQPIVRPLPKEALAKGSIVLNKKNAALVEGIQKQADAQIGQQAAGAA